MRLEFSAPFLDRLAGKRQSYLEERPRKPRAKTVGATPFGAPRWLLEKLKDVLSLAAFVCKKA
jgi:hypothetical protein